MTVISEKKVREDFIRVLIEDYGYLDTEIEVEFSIPRGSNKRDRADIAVFGSSSKRDPARDIIGIIETKSSEREDGADQLKSYMTATSAVWGVWTNGVSIKYFCKQAGGSAIHDDLLSNVPVKGQRLEDVGKVTRADLKPYSGTALKVSFRRILNTLYANTNISRREKLGNEMIKIIFAKIRDEVTFPDSPPKFYAGFGENPRRVKERIDALFMGVVEEYSLDEIFDIHDKITLDPYGVAMVVGQLERGSLVDTPSDVVGDAFEVFAESRFVGEKGEFFTPRSVIDVAVKLVNPKPDSTMCDPACGSGGFLIAGMRAAWAAMERDRQWRNLKDEHLQNAKRGVAARNFFGIEKELDLVRIAKAYMAISGDGKSNIVQQNSLHSVDEFDGDAAQKFVRSSEFLQFDHVMTNPPYGTKTRVRLEDAAKFELGCRWNKVDGEWKKGNPVETNPYILFVERCFELLKDGGTLAIVLPETAFHAPTMSYLRAWITARSRIIAVVDLPHNTFRPYCNAKTCLLVVQKGRHARPDDEIIMAEATQIGHDHLGREVKIPDTEEVWNDFPMIAREIDHPCDETNEFVFTVKWHEVEKVDHFIPRYFAAEKHPPKLPKGRHWLTLGELVDSGFVGAWDGHGSPSSVAKGGGDIPYIRVSDIVNWELYRNPTTGISESTYKSIAKNQQKVRAEDIIFVRRGSYRIGTVAMASPRDEMVLLMKELLTLRVHDNEHGITSYYLLALLSSEIVQQQIPRLTFVDTTLPNIGSRWREILLPVHKDKEKIIELSQTVQRAIEQKWQAQDNIETLRGSLGGIVT